MITCSDPRQFSLFRYRLPSQQHIAVGASTTPSYSQRTNRRERRRKELSRTFKCGSSLAIPQRQVSALKSKQSKKRASGALKIVSKDCLGGLSLPFISPSGTGTRMILIILFKISPYCIYCCSPAFFPAFLCTHNSFLYIFWRTRE
jgi:hypothetical protein